MVYVNFLEQYNMKPWEVDALDADLMEVLLAKLTAASKLKERNKRRQKHGK